MAVQILRRLFSVEEYYLMAKAGILNEDDRLELIEGEIVEMSPIGSHHAACVTRLIQFLSQQVGSRALVSAQNPVRLGEHSEPQPDVALLRPRGDFYATDHPGSQDILLLIEVADTSVEYDREVKVPLYARAGIGEVWLVDLDGESIEVYQSPAPEGYRQVRVVRQEERLAPEALPELELSAGGILGLYS
jgi:Uma2 family endonuclease